MGEGLLGVLGICDFSGNREFICFPSTLVEYFAALKTNNTILKGHVEAKVPLL